MDDHQNQEYDCIHQNLEYGLSSESRSGFYPNLSMDVHQNQGLDLIQI